MIGYMMANLWFICLMEIPALKALSSDKKLSMKHLFLNQETRFCQIQTAYLYERRTEDIYVELS